MQLGAGDTTGVTTLISLSAAIIEDELRPSREDFSDLALARGLDRQVIEMAFGSVIKALKTGVESARSMYLPCK